MNNQIKSEVDKEKMSRRFTLAFKVAVCVAIGIGGVMIGQKCRSALEVRRTIAERIEAIENARPWIRDEAERAGGRLEILVFKNERVVEVHAPGWKSPRRYAMTEFSGRLGPKLREGDGQIPEGLYGIEYLNPNSMFHLSLKVSYPNASDRKRASEEGRTDLGGDIMIHGGSATVGCIPIGDEAIEELFAFASKVGKANISVIIAPYDMRKGRRKELESSPLPWYGALCDEISEALGRVQIAEDVNNSGH